MALPLTLLLQFAAVSSTEIVQDGQLHAQSEGLDSSQRAPQQASQDSMDDMQRNIVKDKKSYLLERPMENFVIFVGRKSMPYVLSSPLIFLVLGLVATFALLLDVSQSEYTLLLLIALSLSALLGRYLIHPTSELPKNCITLLDQYVLSMVIYMFLTTFCGAIIAVIDNADSKRRASFIAFGIMVIIYIRIQLVFIIRAIYKDINRAAVLEAANTNALRITTDNIFDKYTIISDNRSARMDRFDFNNKKMVEAEFTEPRYRNSGELRRRKPIVDDQAGVDDLGMVSAGHTSKEPSLQDGQLQAQSEGLDSSKRAAYLASRDPSDDLQRNIVKEEKASFSDRPMETFVIFVGRKSTSFLLSSPPIFLVLGLLATFALSLDVSQSENTLLLLTILSLLVLLGRYLIHPASEPPKHCFTFFDQYVLSIVSYMFLATFCGAIIAVISDADSKRRASFIVFGIMFTVCIAIHLVFVIRAIYKDLNRAGVLQAANTNALRVAPNSMFGKYTVISGNTAGSMDHLHFNNKKVVEVEPTEPRYSNSGELRKRNQKSNEQARMDELGIVNAGHISKGTSPYASQEISITPVQAVDPALSGWV